MRYCANHRSYNRNITNGLLYDVTMDEIMKSQSYIQPVPAMIYPPMSNTIRDFYDEA